MSIFSGQLNYSLYVFLLLLGLYAMAVKRNYVKKIIGMVIFQTAVIFFFIAASAKTGGNIPIIEHHSSVHHEVHVDQYVNPLPHVLMLTAIVVGVATLGVALAISQSIYREFGSLEEDEVAKAILSREAHK